MGTVTSRTFLFILLVVIVIVLLRWQPSESTDDDPTRVPAVSPAAPQHTDLPIGALPKAPKLGDCIRTRYAIPFPERKGAAWYINQGCRKETRPLLCRPNPAHKAPKALVLHLELSRSDEYADEVAWGNSRFFHLHGLNKLATDRPLLFESVVVASIRQRPRLGSESTVLSRGHLSPHLEHLLVLVDLPTNEPAVALKPIPYPSTQLPFFGEEKLDLSQASFRAGKAECAWARTANAIVGDQRFETIVLLTSGTRGPFGPSDTRVSWLDDLATRCKAESCISVPFVHATNAPYKDALIVSGKAFFNHILPKFNDFCSNNGPDTFDWTAALDGSDVQLHSWHKSQPQSVGDWMDPCSAVFVPNGIVSGDSTVWHERQVANSTIRAAMRLHARMLAPRATSLLETHKVKDLREFWR